MRGRKPRQLTVIPDDIPRLQRIARNTALSWARVRAARIVLAISRGERVLAIAAQVQVDPATVWRIARDFEVRGMAVFGDAAIGRLQRQNRRLSATGTQPADRTPAESPRLATCVAGV